uniref:Cytochrome P450 86A2 n=2 Tax=Aegilops tauschii TaxID=37682 RepID=A0A453A6G9_AEGTS
MGGSLFTIDGEPARRQRAKVQSVLTRPHSVASMAACCHDKVKNSLLPFFIHMATTSTPFDVQELMSRFMFDLAAIPLFSVDPNLLSMYMPPMEAAVALDTVMEVAFLRLMMPASCWKSMRWLNIGPERKLKAAHTVLGEFVTEMLERRKINTCPVGNDEEEEVVDIISSFINDPDYADDDLGQAMIISYMLAARDTVGTTLTWLFYNLTQNPDIISIIRKELSPVASRKVAAGARAMLTFEPDDIESLVYLRATLYETLRLYPPAPLEIKMVAADDILPSGHKVHAGDTILISILSTRRMKSVWGNDCLDYNPSRWLTEDGNNIRYVPSHKFLAFNSGPRMCLGKNIAIMQMKTVIAAVLWNFDVQVVEGQSIQPKPSCILEMKNGLILKLKKRDM